MANDQHQQRDRRRASRIFRILWRVIVWIARMIAFAIQLFPFGEN